MIIFCDSDLDYSGNPRRREQTFAVDLCAGFAMRQLLVRKKTLLPAGWNVETVNRLFVDRHEHMAALVQNPTQLQRQVVPRIAELNLSVVENVKLSWAVTIFCFPMRIPRLARQHLQNRILAQARNGREWLGWF